jgi:Uma2 family endonuclease
MTILVAERKYSADEFEALPDADRYELLHGRLVERDMGAKSSWLATQVTIALGPFLKDHPLGYLFDAQMSYACFPDDPGHAPRPDVSFIRFGRLPNEEVPEGNCRIPPDLLVEVVSPNDNAEELSDKIVEFQEVGVPLIWVIYPGARRVLIHRLPASPLGRISELVETDTISGEDVLPGFKYAVSELFRLPQPLEASSLNRSTPQTERSDPT